MKDFELSLERTRFSVVSTQGELSDADHFYGYSLEPPKNDNGKENVPERTCIPPGRYEITLSPSPHFSDEFFRLFGDRDVPHVNGVDGRDLILVHPGNWPCNTHGCILPGLDGWPPLRDRVEHSADALRPLLVAMRATRAGGGQIWLTVSEKAAA